MRRMLMALLVVAVLFTTTSAFAGDCGDVNNSGTVNALDITYLINYLYKHGPAPDCGTLMDIDGNAYKTMKIGSQVWMAENLRVTHYRNGEVIPNVTDKTAWDALNTGAYCNYSNDGGYVGTYGRLYNWYATSDARNVAPIGWHIPTDAEWKQLEMYLGMIQASADSADAYRGTDQGGQIKESGTAHWASPNLGATNSSGFTALPAGGRSSDFIGMGISAFFWSSTASGSPYAWDRRLSAYWTSIGRYDNSLKNWGFSVRCVKD